jgi:hypothetical protein
MAQFPHELHFRCFTLPPSPLLDMPRADELYHARRALSMTTEVPVALGSVAVTIAGEENARGRRCDRSFPIPRPPFALHDSS